MAAHYGCTAREMGDRLGSDELSEWLAFEKVYGFPDVYFLAGVLAPAIAGPWVTKGKPPTAKDFVPFFDEPKARATSKDHFERFRAMGGGMIT